MVYFFCFDNLKDGTLSVCDVFVNFLKELIIPDLQLLIVLCMSRKYRYVADFSVLEIAPLAATPEV